MKLIMTFLMLFSVSNAFSQATTEATAPTTTTAAANNSSTDLSFWERIKKAPIGLSISNDISAATKSIKGATNEISLGLSYKVTNKNSLSLSTSTAAANFNTPQITTSYGGTTLGFSRSGLLTQEKYGVNMSASLSYKAMAGGNTDNTGRSYLSTSFSRTINPFFTLSTSVSWEERYRKKSDNSLSRRVLYLTVNPTIQLTEKLSTSPTVFLYNYVKGPKVNDYTRFRFAPSLDYSFTKKFSTSLYWDGDPMHSGDGMVLAPRWYASGVAGLTLSYSIL